MMQGPAPSLHAVHAMSSTQEVGVTTPPGEQSCDESSPVPLSISVPLLPPHTTLTVQMRDEVALKEQRKHTKINIH